MNLPSDFEMYKHGLHLRLVNENDAEFIVKLRTDPKLGRYLNPISSDVESQKKWIRGYKKLEAEGKDYYFIYDLDGKSIGLNRIYNIQEDSFVGGSYVFLPDHPMQFSIYAALIQFEIGFNFLNKKKVYGDIRLKNKSVIKFHKMLNVNFTHEDELNCYYELTKESFEYSKVKIEDLLKD